MSDLYSPKLPLDARGTPKQNYPPNKIALASTNKENASTSSVLLFTHNTTEIEVAAVGGPAAGRWAVNSATSVASGAASPNFDFVVPAATVRRFVVPQQTTTNYGSVQGVNRAEGLYNGVAFISAGAASSVLTSEF